jgi:hypothetical protein
VGRGASSVTEDVVPCLSSTIADSLISLTEIRQLIVFLPT